MRDKMPKHICVFDFLDLGPDCVKKFYNEVFPIYCSLYVRCSIRTVCSCGHQYGEYYVFLNFDMLVHACTFVMYTAGIFYI